MLGGNKVGLAICIGLVLLLVVFSEKQRNFLCPRCKEPFFQRLLLIDTTANHCVHCGLPFGDEPAEKKARRQRDSG